MEGGKRRPQQDCWPAMSFVDDLDADRGRRRWKALLVLASAGLIGALVVLRLASIDHTDDFRGTGKLVLLWIFFTSIAATAIGILLLVLRVISTVLLGTEER
jgi:hypothetical protein